MQRSARAWRVAVAAGALSCLLLAGFAAAAQLRAESPEVDAAWREIFRREPVSPAPADNPLTAEKAALGARLFVDMRLSGRSNRACVTCHRPERAFADARRRPLGLSGAVLPRNTPALWNLAWGRHFFWDGRAPSLEAQVVMPIEAREEMNGDWPTILHRLEADANLAIQFWAAFPAEEPPLSQATVAKALASYVRTLISPPTRFDAWVDGDAQALQPAERRGFRLFIGKAGCVLCHVGWRFTDDRLHDIGLPGRDDARGGAVAGGTPGLRAFKTPGLRELRHTAPYMHDGSLPNLKAVLAHYTGNFVARASLAPHMRRDLRLSASERRDLIAFLLTLSSEAPPAPSPAAQH